MTTRKLYEREKLHETEQNIRDHCLHRVVGNDGEELRRLFKDECAATDVTHIGNFVFAVKSPRFNQFLIFTEPIGAGEEHFQITGYSINP